MGANAGIARGLGAIGVGSQVSDTATGVLINLAPIGSDAATFSLSSPADAGSVLIGGAQSATIAGQAALTVTGVPSGVNGLTITQTTGSTAPTINATGTATNLGLILNSKGTGAITLQCGGGGASISLLATGNSGWTIGGATSMIRFRNSSGNDIFQLVSVTSSTNGISQTAAADGSSPTIAAFGANDSNIDLTLAGKGTGLVNFSNASVAISGTISPATLAPTTGGATGPANAAQNSWGKMKWNGTTFYVPLWT